MKSSEQFAILLIAGATLTFPRPSHAQQQSEEELATKLNNPVAALISVPLQFNWDQKYVPSGTQNISSTFIQPILSYTTTEAWTFSLNAESTYDWRNSQWTVPIHATVSKLVRFGKQPVSLGASVRYYADSAVNGPHGWGARLIVTFLFPE